VLSFLQRHRGVVVVGVLLVLPLVLLYAQTRRGGAHGPVVGFVVDFAGVIERGVLWAAGGIADGVEHYVTSVSAWDELMALRRERVARTALEDRIAELSIENETLRALANSAAAVDGPRPLGARVIGRRGQPLTRLVVIDKGARHGVRRGDGVMGAEGVVGVVLTAARASSEVLLLSDASSALDIVVQRSRARGILRGRGDDDRYAAAVEDFDRLRDVRPGDVVVTSGFGARFPPGTRVGTIAEVKDRDDLNVEAVIVPAVNLARVEHVSVLVGRESPPPPALGDSDDEGTFGSGVPGGGAQRPGTAAPDAGAGRRRKRGADGERTADDKKADDKKADDKKVDDKNADDKKVDDKKVDDKEGDDKKVDDKEADDKKADDQKADDQKADDQKADDKKADDKDADDKDADDKDADDKDADDKKADDKKADDQKADDQKADELGAAGERPAAEGEPPRRRRRRRDSEPPSPAPGESATTGPSAPPPSADGAAAPERDKREQRRRRKKRDAEARAGGGSPPSASSTGTPP